MVLLRGGAYLAEICANRTRCAPDLIREGILFLGRPAPTDIKDLHGELVSHFVHFKVFGRIDLHI